MGDWGGTVVGVHTPRALVVVPSSASIERDVGMEKKKLGRLTGYRDDGGSEEGALEAGEAGPKGGE